jgi:hypothetical protein
MSKKSGLFIRESVIGLGFFSGLWTSIGINPQTILLNMAESSTDAVLHDPSVRLFFVILPTILLLFSVITAYRRGKLMGLFSVIIAYAGGLSILNSPVFSVFLLVIAVIVGFFATTKWH